MVKKTRHINPDFKAKPLPKYSFEECVEALEDGRFEIIAHLISKAESLLESDQFFVQKLLENTKAKKNVRKIAVSGAPGVGKSSLINRFGLYLCESGHKIAVLPVDPSSHVSKGSILGDKTRMEGLSQSDNAFIKPMSSALSLGGLAPSTAVASMICQRSVFDYIIFETVGVGQSEVEARNISDMFILLLQPGGGDELQGIKRGIMEMADLFVITKSDGSLLSDSEETARQIRQANSLLMKNAFGWKPKVIMHSSVKSTGNEKILECINQYYAFMDEKNGVSQLRRMQEKALFNKRSIEIMLSYLRKDERLSNSIDHMITQLETGEILALQALQKLQDLLNEKS